MKKRRFHPRVYGAAWFLFVLVFITAMFTLSFFLTGMIYARVHYYPGLWAAEMVNFLVGLLLTGTIIGLVGNLARSRGWIPEMNVFRPIIEAVERIAKGDFSARVTYGSDEGRDNQIVGQLASSINKMAVELDQMESLRQEFISNVSHEIQSPLTSIRGFAEALQNPALSPEERSHYLTIIQTESTRLSRITENLLRLASLESDQVRFEPQPYRLDRQIRGLILASEPQWAGKSLEMDVTLEEATLNADEDLLSQVWINLIHNSIKFTPPGGKVCVALRRQAEGVQFQISDTGIGISAADQARIFERFFKADPSRERSNEGSGLGLSIVQKIVEMHRGSIRVESQPGSGTTFTVTLPQE